MTPAFMFGHAFPLASRIGLVARHRDGSRWAVGSGPHPMLMSVEVAVLDGGDESVAVVEVSIARGSEHPDVRPWMTWE